MNRAEAKNLVSSLRYLQSVSEGAFLTVIDDGAPDLRLKDAEKALEHTYDVLTSIIGKLPLVDPNFKGIDDEVEREALERGRKWSDERAVKIALLRLAGDDTPEEHIPI